MSRVLAVHRYYWPDTPPYASLLRAIVREWTDQGHDVDVLAGQPSYKPEAALSPRPSVEGVDGATVRRIAMKPDRSARWRKVLNVFRFPVAVTARVLFGRGYDVVMCSTVPPVLLGWFTSWAATRRGARFIYHCMDLHPEIGRLSGEFSHPAVYRLLARLELATCRRSAAIIVLSEDMRDAVLARDPTLDSRVVVLTNFELPDFDSLGRVASPVPANETAIRIVFTGNLGRFQGLDSITRVVLDPDAELDGLELIFMGEGAVKADLEALVQHASPATRSRVSFVPHGSPAAVRALLATADLGLVSLAPDVIRYAYPSKMATYLGAGLAVLVAVDERSALARGVVGAGAGRVLPTDHPSSTRKVLEEIVANAGELEAMAENAAQLGRDEYASERLLPRWADLLARVTTEPPLVSGPLP